MIKKILLLTFLFSFSAYFSQSRYTDSLIKELKKNQHDTIKCKILELIVENEMDDRVWPKYNSMLGEIADKNMKSTFGNHIFYKKKKAYVLNNIGYIAELNGDYKKALEYYNKSKEIQLEVKDNAMLAVTCNNIGSIMQRNGNLIKGLVQFKEAYQLSLETGDKKTQALCLSNIGTNLCNQGNVAKGLEELHKSIKLYEELGDAMGLSNCINNVASFYDQQGDNEKALQYFTKALKINDSIGNRYSYGTNLYNIATHYIRLKNYNSAIQYYKQALDVFKSINYTVGFAAVHKSLGNYNVEMKNIDEAIINHLTALEIYKQLNDSLGQAECLFNLANDYYFQKKIDKALPLATEALKISQVLNSPEKTQWAAMILKKIYTNKKDFRLAFQMYELENAMRDSVQSDKNKRAVIKTQLKYEYEKQLLADSVAHAKENELKNIELKKQEAELKVKKNQQYALFGGLILVIVFASFIYNRFKVTQKQNLIIEQKEKETKDQKEIIEEKQKEIIDSINYAKRIQYTLLAHDEYLDEYLKDYFVYFQPKDIVSGDFYWATSVNSAAGNCFYLAVCDCTGHGVPGAFMSLLSIGFLSEAIKEKHIQQPGEIFNYVRKRLIENISKEDQKDGFDGILICINNTENKITYAAANNEPVLVSENNFTYLPTDKMPVGIGISKHSFNTYELNYKKGDSLYIYTDGYADQFGGPRGKKFKYKQLNELLLASSTSDVALQKENLKTNFNSWKGNLEQVDDVCIIGIRL